MKKVITSVATASSLLFLSASQTFALTICSSGTIGEFSKICGIGNGDANTTFSNLIGFGLNILFIVAVILALFFLVWGGIQYILSGGDKGKTEAARGHIIAAVIGLVIVFVAYFLLQVVLGVFGISLSNISIPTAPGVSR
jgi:hypothetical protein